MLTSRVQLTHSSKRLIMARKPLKAEKYQMPKEHLKGVARRRGEPIMYDEVKVNWNLKITPTAKKLISDAAKLENFSPS